MNAKEIFDYWLSQVKKSEKKTCGCCNFLCFDIEPVCARCGAYIFNPITDEEANKMSICDIKLDSFS